MSSSKFEYSPESQTDECERADSTRVSRPLPAFEPDWSNDMEVPQSCSSEPPSTPPDSSWCDPSVDSECYSEDDDGGATDDQPETCRYSWAPHDAPSSLCEPALPAPLDLTDKLPAPPSSIGALPPSSAPESALIHSSGAFHTTRTAAAHMGISPSALRKQCRNGAGPDGCVADLGGGIVAFKVGKHWRIRFPWWQ